MEIAVKEILFNLMMLILFLVALFIFGFLYLIDKLPFDINRKTLDPIYAFIENWSSKMNAWSWRKRWGDKDKGTGYRD